ncbi:MAG: phage tail-like protein [Haloarculaceae archaeon]|jgi:phage tail-like protein
MSTGSRVDPYLDFRFLVEIESLIVGGFAEVEGIEFEVDTEEYEEGGVNHYTHVLPTRTTSGTVTLRRGLTDAEGLWDWARAGVRGTADRRVVRVILLDREGSEAAGWVFHRAMPVRWSGPDLAAENGQVAMEELELAYETMARHGGAG